MKKTFLTLIFLLLASADAGLEFSNVAETSPVAQGNLAFRCHGRINAQKTAGTTAPLSAGQITQWNNQHFCEDREGSANVVGFGAMWANNTGSTIFVRLPIVAEFNLGRIVVLTTPITTPAIIAAEVTKVNNVSLITFSLNRPVDFYYSLIHGVQK